MPLVYKGEADQRRSTELWLGTPAIKTLPDEKYESNRREVAIILIANAVDE